MPGGRPVSLRSNAIQALLAQSEVDELVIEAAPSLKAVEGALRIAHLSLLRAIEAANEVSKLGLEGDLHVAYEALMIVWPKRRD